MTFENVAILVYVFVGAFILVDSFVDLRRVLKMKNKDGFTGWMAVCGYWTYLDAGRVVKVMCPAGPYDVDLLECVPYQYNVRRGVWYPCHTGLSAYSKAFQRGNISFVNLASLSPQEQSIALDMEVNS